MAKKFNPEMRFLGATCMRGHGTELGNWRYTRNKHCCECSREKSAEWFAKNKDRRRAYTKDNAPRRIVWQRKHALKGYGLTEAEHAEMISRQGGVCAICKRAPSGKRHHAMLHIDHCHKTGRVRGLLCATCNATLGMAKDNPETLRLAASYLEVARG